MEQELRLVLWLFGVDGEMSAAERDVSARFSRGCDGWMGVGLLLTARHVLCVFESLEPWFALLMGWEREGCLTVQKVNFCDCATLQT